MNRLVVGNLVHRPLRSVISAVAVAIEVIMILSIAAIMLGMLNGQKTRATGIGGDVIAKPGTTSNLMGVSGAPASTKAQQVLEKLPHVQVAAPVYIQLVASGTLEGHLVDSFSLDEREGVLRAAVTLSRRVADKNSPWGHEETTNDHDQQHRR